MGSKRKRGRKAGSTVPTGQPAVGVGGGSSHKGHGADGGRLLTKQDLESIIPLGHPDLEWTDRDWDRLQGVIESYDQKVQDQIWDYVWEHRYGVVVQGDEDIANTLLKDKSVHDMTDEEWASFETQVYGEGQGTYDSLLDSLDVTIEEAEKQEAEEKAVKKYNKALTKAEREDPKRKTDDRCTDICHGPTHPTDPKWGTHIGSCPCYDPKVDGPPAGTTYTPACKHKMVSLKLDAGMVYASSRRYNQSDDDEDDTVKPTLGVYLDDAWIKGVLTTPGIDAEEFPLKVTGHPYVWLDWPDYNLPNVTDEGMVSFLRWMLKQIESGETVEVGCIGGHGRTGSLLAALLTVEGVLPATAVLTVREVYCKRAVESIKQVSWVADIHEAVHGREWEWNKEEMERYYKLMKTDNKPVSSFGSYDHGYGPGPGSGGGSVSYLQADGTWTTEHWD